MTQHIEQHARELGITRIELDSRIQRHAVHRFYPHQHYRHHLPPLRPYPGLKSGPERGYPRRESSSEEE